MAQAAGCIKLKRWAALALTDLNGVRDSAHGDGLPDLLNTRGDGATDC
jgi:hypothetical protein